jgi:hypothetical protein
MAATQITQRFIADNAINNAKVQAGAAIDTSKLADGAEFMKRGGTVAMTGALNMGNQLITNVATPSTTTDAANKAYVDGLIAGLNSIFDGKGSVRAASTANVNVANPGTAVFDGVTLVATERLLLKNQTAPAENGIYVFTASGSALTRATDFDAWSEIPGAVVAVEEGTANADTLWLSTSNAGGTLGTTAITWFNIPTTTGLASANFVDKETPSGSVNGSNVTFTLANTPVSGSEHVYVQGILMDVGASNDYTISGATITMLTAPLTGEKIRVTYRK